MKMTSFGYMQRVCICLVLLLMATGPCLHAQLADRVYKTDYQIGVDRKGELRVEVDNISFFRDNEYSTRSMDGYTLPGFWVQPKAVYYPLDNIKLELGVHMLRYWGADKYPNMAYQDIAYWKGRHQDGLHILPFFRAQAALSDHVNIVLGHLYGGANHNLIAPLYCPELNMTADPEAGLQVLYHSKRFDLDAWVNWESFIFRNDVHQEAFIVGLSSRLKLNDEQSPLHFYLPLQAVIQHRGGEIDTINTSSVQTLMNGALGVGATWTIDHPLIKRANVELDGLGYYQQAGTLWPYDSGAAFHAQASVDLHDFRVKGGYFVGHKFISLLGYPMYGCVSTKEQGLTFPTMKTGYIGVEYSHTFAPGYALGIDVDLYCQGKCTAVDAAGQRSRTSMATSFAAGIYLRIHPSFLIKRFGAD